MTTISHRVNPSNIPYFDPTQNPLAQIANLVNSFLLWVIVRLIFIPHLSQLRLARQAAAIEEANFQYPAQWVMQSNLPHLHNIVDFEDYHQHAVSEQPISMLEAVFNINYLPDIMLLLHCEIGHDVDQFCDHKFWKGYITSKTNDSIELTICKQVSVILIQRDN
jgi:hypothetical protein